MVNVSEGQLEHFKDECVPLLDQTLLLLLQGAQAGGIHLGKGIDVVSASELSIDLHYELSLTMKLFSVEQFLVFKLAARVIGLLGFLDLIHTCLNYLILEQNTLLKLLGSLAQSFLCRSVMPLVICTLFVKFELKGASHISLQCKYIKIGVALHKIGQSDKSFFDVCVDS